MTKLISKLLKKESRKSDYLGMKKEKKSTRKTKFSMLKAIKANEIYKQKGRDDKARKEIDENISRSTQKKVVPGQMILFEYFNPITKDDLEYYDASPCTLFFNVFKSQKGKRVLGFNLHYFPAKIRYNIMDAVFKIYNPQYTKYFKSGLTKDLDGFDYEYLVEFLKKYGLEWCVRMYDPRLMANIRVIPPDKWSTAALTEGWFKKKSKRQILKFWRDWFSKRKA